MDAKFFESAQTIIDNTKDQRPSVGKFVKVVKGRKHNGKLGIVRWHGEDRFDTTRKYLATPEQVFVSEAIGRIGYRVKIETQSGEKFFVSADYVEVIN